MDAQKKARAAELTKQLAELFADAGDEDGSFKTLDEMELAANEVGDQISTRVLQESVNKSVVAETACPRCPKCDRPGRRREDPDPRIVQTSRGEVQWTEDEYFCRKCRKAFFPSDGAIGTEG